MTLSGQIFEGNYAKKGSEFNVTSNEAGGLGSVDVAGFTDGSFVVSWVLDNAATSQKEVYAQRFDQDGGAEGDSFLIAEGSGHNVDPKILTFQDGGFIVTWIDEQYETIYAQKYLGNGDIDGDVITVNNPTLIRGKTFDVDILEDGRLIFAWQDAISETNPNHETTYRIFNADGSSTSGSVPSIISSSTYSKSTVLALDGGGFAISYIIREYTGSILKPYDVVQKIQIYDADGNKVGASFSMNQLASKVSMLQLGDGSLLVEMYDSYLGNTLLHYDLNGNEISKVNDHLFKSREFLALEDGGYVEIINRNWEIEQLIRNADGSVRDASPGDPINNVARANEQSEIIIYNGKLLIKDLDGDAITAMKVSIVGNYVSGEDVLRFLNDEYRPVPFEAVFDVETGELVIRPIPGAEITNEDFTNLINRIIYENISDTPNGDNREIYIQISDGQLWSAPVIIDLTVHAIDDGSRFEAPAFAIEEGEALTLAVEHLDIYDPDSEIGNPYFYVSGYYHGTIEVNGEFSRNFYLQDVLDGKVKFIHDGSEEAPSLKLLVKKDAESYSWDGDEKTVDISFTNVNDDAAINSSHVSTSKGSTTVLSQQNFSLIDDDDDIGVMNLRVENIVSGHFELEGTEVTEFTMQQVMDGKVTFVHDGSDIAPSFEVAVKDDSLNAEFSPAIAATISHNTNAAPVVGETFVPVTEGEITTLTVAHLNITDLDSEASDVMIHFSNVTNGWFVGSYNDSYYTSLQAVINGTVKFQHNGSENPPTFDIAVRDNMHGYEYGPAESVGVEFSTVNDLPYINVPQITVFKGQDLIMTAAHFDIVDPDDSPDNIFIHVNSSQFATLEIGGTEVTEFTLADVLNGQVKLIHDGSENEPLIYISVKDLTEGSDYLDNQSIDVNLIDPAALTSYQGGATLYRDLNGDGVLGEAEVAMIVDPNGQGHLDLSAGRLIAVGGVDFSTGFDYGSIELSAQEGATVINILTTLVDSMGGDQTRLKEAFSLRASLDLNHYDPVANLVQDTTFSGYYIAKDVTVIQKLGISVHSISGLVEGAGIAASESEAFDLVITALAEELLHNEEGFNFLTAGGIEKIINIIDVNDVISAGATTAAANVVGSLLNSISFWPNEITPTSWAALKYGQENLHADLKALGQDQTGESSTIFQEAHDLTSMQETIETLRPDLPLQMYEASVNATNLDNESSVILNFEGSFYPKVLELSNGNYLSVWTDQTLAEDTEGSGIYGQVYDAAGTAIGGHFLVNQETAGNQEQFHVAVKSDGGFVVGWGSRDIYPGTGFKILYRQFDDTGTALSDDIEAFAWTDNFAVVENIFITDDGNIVMNYSDYEDGTLNVYTKIFASDNTLIQDTFNVAANAELAQNNLTFTSLSNNKILATWEQDGDVIGRILDTSGTGITGEFIIGEHIGTEYYNSNARILQSTELANGQVISLFSVNGISYGQFINADGTISGQKFQLNQKPDQFSVYENSLTALPDGGFYLVGHEQYFTPNMTNFIGIRYDANDEMVNAPTILGNSYSNVVSITVTGADSFLVDVQFYSYDDKTTTIVSNEFVFVNTQPDVLVLSEGRVVLDDVLVSTVVTFNDAEGDAIQQVRVALDQGSVGYLEVDGELGREFTLSQEDFNTLKWVYGEGLAQIKIQVNDGHGWSGVSDILLEGVTENTPTAVDTGQIIVEDDANYISMLDTLKLPNGDIMYLWTKSGEEHFKILDQNGVVVIEETSLPEYTTYNTRVFIQEDGTLAFFWTEGGNAFYQNYDTSGNALAEQIQLTMPTEVWGSVIQIEGDTFGYIVDPDEVPTLYKFDLQSLTEISTVSVALPAEWDRTISNQILPLEGGGYAFIFSQEMSSPTNLLDDMNYIFMQVFDATDTPTSELVKVGLETDVNFISAEQLNNGEIVIVWEASRIVKGEGGGR